MNVILRLLGTMAISLATANTAMSAVFTYTDRTDWENAISAVSTEDFTIDAQQQPLYDQLDNGQFLNGITYDFGLVSLRYETSTGVRDGHNDWVTDPTGIEGDISGDSIRLRADSVSTLLLKLEFDQAVTGFGADFYNLSPFTGVSFVVGSNTVDMYDEIGSKFGFLGVTTYTPFTEISFVVDEGQSEAFYIDNVSIAQATPVPLPATAYLLGTGFLGFAALRKKLRPTSLGKSIVA